MTNTNYKCASCGDPVYKDDYTCPVCDFLKLSEDDTFFESQNQ